MSIKTAVIPAAGLGSRFLPTTKCCPKELIPLVDKPCVLHVVEEAVAAGVEDIIFVISKDKDIIKDFFSDAPKLSHWLTERGQTEEHQKLERISTMAKYHFVYQDNPLGLGHAVNCARDFVNDDHFFVLLPDDIFQSTESVCQQLLKGFSKQKGAYVSVMPVDWNEVSRYGIVQASSIGGAVGQVEDIIEKPKRELAPSNLAVMGRYILPREVFKILDLVQPGSGGEIQLTDALRVLVGQNKLYSFAFDGERFDTGTPQGWLEANLILGLRDARFGKSLRETLKKLSV